MKQLKIVEQEIAANQSQAIYHLPEGWTSGKFEDLIGRGGILTDGDWIESKDQDPKGDIRLIQLADIGDGFYKNKSVRFLTSEKAKELACTFLTPGDILIARMPEPLGRACIFPGDPKRAVTAVDICIVRPAKRGANHRWIMHMINSPVMRRQIESLQRGTTRKRISRRNLASLIIPIPPLAEQGRIVTKVEQLLARMNATKERLAKVTVILKRFRQAVLAGACSGQLTSDWRNENLNVEPADQLLERIRRKYQQKYENESKKAKLKYKSAPKKPPILEKRTVNAADLPDIPGKWTWVYLPYLGFMNRGKSKHRPRNAPHLYEGPYPFIQTGDVAQSEGRITSHKQTYSEAGLTQSHLWPAGTVCVTIAANIASSALLTYPACFPDSIVGLIPDADLCLPEYAEFFIRTARSNLDQFAPATAQKNINIAILSDVAVPLPPFAEQQEIVRRVETLFRLADSAEKRLINATARAENLAQAILAKAFRGELVSTEAELALRERRSYEPASALLARIKAECAEKGANLKPAGRSALKNRPKKVLTKSIN